MTNVNELPKTREEYLVWSLEWSGRFTKVYSGLLSSSRYTRLILTSWIEYTLEEFPDLITVYIHGGGGSFTVSIAGVDLCQYLMSNNASLGRRLIDHPEVKVKKRNLKIK